VLLAAVGALLGTPERPLPAEGLDDIVVADDAA
jgi:hypothetical protein